MDAPMVLLIDGDRDSLVIYSLILRHYGYRVLQAENAEVGFALACEHRPNLVVLEPFVPPVQGRSMTDLLRTDARTAGLPVLLITAVPTMLEMAAPSDLPRTGYLTKPCQPRLFLAEVQRRLAPVLTAA